MEIGLENIGMPIVIAELYPGPIRADNWRYEPDLTKHSVIQTHLPPWTKSKAFLDEVHFQVVDQVQAVCPRIP